MRMVGPGINNDPTLKELADYCSKIADGAQLRILRRSTAKFEGSVPDKLLDDDWWQGVMDFVRYELFRLAREQEKKDADKT